MEEFFRRHPPLFAWDSEAIILQSFSQCYMIRQEDSVVGLLSLSNYDPQNKRVELGLLIDRELCTHSVAKTFIMACRQAADFLFGYLGYNKIYTLILEHREGLIHTMTSHGFKLEGMLRDNIFWKGRFWDERLYGLTKEDFERGS